MKRPYPPWILLTVLLAFGVGCASLPTDYPNISDVLFHSMCIPSFAHQKRIQHLAQQPTVRFVRPPITADGFFTVDVETSKRYEQTAYEVAMRELEDAKALNL